MTQYPSEPLDPIRKHFEEEKAAIVARIQELSTQDPFSDPDRGIDNAASDREASEESDHDRYLAMIEELQKKVQSIDDALLRISTGTYGFCSSCGSMIDTNRLSILPTATLCLSCEQKKIH